MRVMEFKIKTKKKNWLVNITSLYGLQYFVESEYEGFYGQVHNVPLSIRKRARCFIANPTLFGTLRRM